METNGNEENRKIVFVLGAGFSKCSNAPMQNKILELIFRLNTDYSKQVKEFVKSFFGHENSNLPLEDIFTVLDKSISRDDALREYEMDYLNKVRKSLNNSIAHVFADKLNGIDRAPYINDFADLLLKLRLRSQKDDEVSVISTNWDLLLDNALGEKMEAEKLTLGYRRAYVDYCIRDRQLTENNDIPVSLTIKALNKFNLKLLKVHGSLNWLKCPNCDALFVEFNEKLAFSVIFNPIPCRECSKNHHVHIPLRPFLVSPTFVKDLSTVHLKMAWWNAGYELSEATHIVFIGYSLPLSDFELRYLLARYIKKTTERNRAPKIKVVLYSDTPANLTYEQQLEKNRYLNFFGEQLREVDISFKGVVDYVEEMKSTNDLFW